MIDMLENRKSEIWLRKIFPVKDVLAILAEWDFEG
jgi:hypothetical protein